VDWELGVLREITERARWEMVGERDDRVEEDARRAGDSQFAHQVFGRWDLNRNTESEEPSQLEDYDAVHVTGNLPSPYQ